MSEWILYVGTYSQEETAVGASRGIYCYQAEPQSGSLRLLSSEEDRFNPSYLALSPDGRFLYAADEMSDSSVISAYRIDQGSHQLSFLNRKVFPGRCMANINISRDGRTLFAANYISGSVLSVRVAQDGAVGELASDIVHRGSSVNPVRQSKPYAHCAMPDRTGKRLIVCDLGTDRLSVYDIKGDTGALSLSGTCPVPAGEGPRHLVFDRAGSRAFLMTEMGSSVIRYDYDQDSGRLTQRQMLSTLPAGSRHESTGADIHLSPDEHFLYASNRDLTGGGNDTVARFRFEGESLVPDGFIRVGAIPRGFALSPDGRLLMVCCQQDNCVEVYEARTGTRLHREEIPSPSCVKFSSDAGNAGSSMR